MKRTTFAAILAGLLLAALGAAGGYWYARYAQRHAHTEPAPSAAATTKSAPDAARRVLYWHDPMVPGQKFDKPGRSPFMNMDLVPVYADEVTEGNDSGKVAISARTTQNLGIRIADVKAAQLQTGFTVTGAVSVDERTLSVVQARVNGYIEKLHVRAQYDTVARGQVLAEIYSPEWLSAQEEYLVLKRSAQPDAEPLAQAARARLALLGVSQAQIQRIEQTGKPEPRVTLHAPEAGVVWELAVRDGMAVNPGTPLFRLANLGTVWVNAEVAETEAALVRPGAPVTARAAALPEAVYKGTVATLLPDVNAATRTIKARIVLANPGARLKPGMFVSVTFDHGAQTQSALTVPAEAVIYTGKRSVVIVAGDGGKFHPVDVEVGRDSGDLIEIRKGLSAGQKVVVSGQFLIDSESSLKTTLNRLQAAPDATSRPTQPAQYSGSGKINRIDAAKGALEISHGPMPSIKWPAMSMTFRADKAVLGAAKAGDDIEFDMLAAPDKNGDYILTRIAPRHKTGAHP